MLKYYLILNNSNNKNFTSDNIWVALVICPSWKNELSNIIFNLYSLIIHFIFDIITAYAFATFFNNIFKFSIFLFVAFKSTESDSHHINNQMCLERFGCWNCIKSDSDFSSYNLLRYISCHFNPLRLFDSLLSAILLNNCRSWSSNLRLLILCYCFSFITTFFN